MQPDRVSDDLGVENGSRGTARRAGRWRTRGRSYFACGFNLSMPQLALVGTFAADDDPEAPEIYRASPDYAGPDPDVHFFTDPERVGPTEVNAFQSASSVILQRSTREGFGLTVTEAMWKARPVVATPAASGCRSRTGTMDTWSSRLRA